MISREHIIEQIEKELAMARQALRDGNDGKARVCARRAAGVAIAWFVLRNRRQDWRQDALDQLNHLKDDPTFPSAVRDAATRLTTKVSERFRYPFSTDPLDDAQIIIDYIRKFMDAQAD